MERPFPSLPNTKHRGIPDNESANSRDSTEGPFDSTLLQFPGWPANIFSWNLVLKEFRETSYQTQGGAERKPLLLLAGLSHWKDHSSQQVGELHPAAQRGVNWLDTSNCFLTCRTLRNSKIKLSQYHHTIAMLEDLCLQDLCLHHIRSRQCMYIFRCISIIPKGLFVGPSQGYCAGYFDTSVQCPCLTRHLSQDYSRNTRNENWSTLLNDQPLSTSAAYEISDWIRDLSSVFLLVSFSISLKQAGACTLTNKLVYKFVTSFALYGATQPGRHCT